MRGFKIPWGSIYHTGGDSVFNKGVQLTIGFKIPYDTGTIWDNIR
jgi:hypothetical protein